MNKARIYQAIEDPALLSDIPLDELERLRDAYPWFSTAQALLAKAYQIKDDHRFTDQLRHAAIYSGNRRLLYEFIRKEISPEKSVPSDEALEPLDRSETADGAIPTFRSSPETGVIGPAGPESESDTFFELFDAPTTPRENGGDTIHEPIEARSIDQDHPFDDLVEAILEEETSPNILSAEPEIEIKAVDAHSSFQLADPFVPESVQETLPKPAPIDRIDPQEDAPEKARQAIDVHSMDALEKAILAEAVSSSIKLEMSQPEIEEEGTQEEQVIDQQSIPAEIPDESSDDPYTLWLQRRAREIHYEASESDQAEKASNTADQEPFEIKPTGHPVAPRIAMEVPGKQTHQADLIERFMRLEPKITPGKSNEYDTVNIAKESLEEDFDLVTETMARLYAQQGKLDKARKVYRRLIELHPEKSVYFAAQLKILNTLKKG